MQVDGIDPPCISKLKSIVHETTDSCVLVKCTAAQCNLERQQVKKTKLLYNHEFCNNLF